MPTVSSKEVLLLNNQ